MQSAHVGKKWGACDPEFIRFVRNNQIKTNIFLNTFSYSVQKERLIELSTQLERENQQFGSRMILM